MRKITQEAALAFNQFRAYKNSNTQVTTDFRYIEHKDSGEPLYIACLYLHGNMIAKKNNDKLTFSLAGLPTPTTHERLRGLGINVFQSKGKQYLNVYAIPFDIPKEINPNKWYDTQGNEA